jgi:hypothetical protein
MMNTPMRCLAAVVFLTLATTASAAAATPSPPAANGASPEPISGLAGRPDVVGQEMLGGAYQNPRAGIAFHTPLNCVQLKTTGDEIARFANEKAGWEIICTRSSAQQPMPLSGGGKDGPKMGLLEVVAARLKQANPGADIVRQEVEDLGEYRAGIIAARLSAVGQRKLFQQAIIQANDQLYYTLSMTSPAAEGAKGADGDDPAEKVAAETFRQMVDTVKLLDRSAVKEDQNQRLFRTRAFLTTLTPKKLRETVVPVQLMRLIQDGKDIGYMCIFEEVEAVRDENAGAADAAPADAAVAAGKKEEAGGGGLDRVKIGIRSRTYPDAETIVDGETWYIVNADRRHEDWSNLMWIQNRKTKKANQIVEIGSSDRRTNRRVDNQLAMGDGKDPKQPPVQAFDTYELSVKTDQAEPIKRSLPPFYMPQALGHLLPRLLPTREPKTFLFATYVGDRREVMMRYVDVGTEQEVTVGGQRVRAVPITDRIGLEGSPTIHYIDPATNKYLGSVNSDSKMTILPTDAQTLQKTWANADLSKPAEQQPPAQRSPAPAASTDDGAVKR